MKHFISISIFILLTIISCNKQPDKIIDLTNGKILYLSDIADSLSYIHLETSDTCLLGAINDIQYEDEIFYVYDKMTFSIYSFDKQGKFLSKLTHYGQGFGEYVNISAFAVDANKNIHILDLIFKKILVYNNNGNFLYEVGVEDFIRDFYVSNTNYVLCMPDKNIGYRQGIFYFDPQKNKYDEIITIEGDNKINLPWYIVRFKENEIHVIDNNNNDLYYVEGNKNIKNIHFEFQPIAKNIQKGQKKAYGLICYNETDKLSLFTFASIFNNTDPEIRLYLYDKQINSGDVYRDIKNDIDNIEMGVPTRLSVNNNLIFVCQGWGNNEGDYNNPVLQIVHIKNK